MNLLTFTMVAIQPSWYAEGMLDVLGVADNHTDHFIGGLRKEFSEVAESRALQVAF